MAILARLAHLRDRLAVHDDERARLIYERDVLIRKADGSLREIGEAAGLSHVAVANIRGRPH